MIPLAVSGRIVIGAAIGLALLVMMVLFRWEARDHAAERAEEETARDSDHDP